MRTSATNRSETFMGSTHTLFRFLHGGCWTFRTHQRVHLHRNGKRRLSNGLASNGRTAIGCGAGDAALIIVPAWRRC